MSEHFLSDLIISWYKDHARDLPWRHTQDGYAIWLSEVIMQQTRVQQGMSYYNRFLETYPTVLDLAQAPLEEVLKLWQGLGYYSRARNLHAAAKKISQEFDGCFPSTYADILSLPGVGAYTAAAIASFAFDLPHAVVDGNVYRVLSRLYDEATPIDTGVGKKLFQHLADQLLSPLHPALHNQAMMEIGALVCTPTQPNCQECPLQAHCLAYAADTIPLRPQKQGKVAQRDRYFYYFIIECEGKLYIHQRIKKDIWSHLFEFYLLEKAQPAKIDELLEDPFLQQLYQRDDQFELRIVAEDVRHLLSHQRIHATFYHLKGVKPLLPYESLQIIDAADFQQYPIPQLLVKVLQKDGFLL